MRIATGAYNRVSAKPLNTTLQLEDQYKLEIAKLLLKQNPSTFPTSF